jgi:hypothetical protein
MVGTSVLIEKTCQPILRDELLATITHLSFPGAVFDDDDDDVFYAS